jgi:predicted  nucleic acid-binding Zn-ribbon protein
VQHPQRLKAKEQLVRNNRELERMKKNLTAIDEQQSDSRARLESTLDDLDKLKAALAKAQAGLSSGGLLASPFKQCMHLMLLCLCLWNSIVLLIVIPN